VKLGPEVATQPLYLLEITAQPLGPQQVRVGVNGTTLDTIELSERAMRTLPVVVPGRVLIPDGPNTITLEPSAPTSTPDDPRQMAVALHGLRLSALPAGFDGVRFADDVYFGEGFSAAETAFRWTDGGLARVLYPMGAVADGGSYSLQVRATSYGRQRAELLVNGTPVGEMTFSGLGLEATSITVPGRLLKGETINRVELRLPDAVFPPGDSRRVALAVRSISIAPAPADGAGPASGEAALQRSARRSRPSLVGTCATNGNGASGCLSGDGLWLQGRAATRNSVYAPFRPSLTSVACSRSHSRLRLGGRPDHCRSTLSTSSST